MGTHIRNLAQTMIRELKVNDEDLEYETESGKGFQAFYDRWANGVKARISKMRYDTLAHIIVQGKGSDHDSRFKPSMGAVHNDDPWLDDQVHGRGLLVEIAVTAIIAEMIGIFYQQIWEDFES